MSVRWSVGPSVYWLVRQLVRNAFVKIAKSIGKSSFFACMLHVHPFMGLSTHYSVCLSIILSICLSIRPSTRLIPHCKNCKIYWKIIIFCVYVACPSISWSVRQSFCLSVHYSVHLFVHPSIHTSGTTL